MPKFDEELTAPAQKNSQDKIAQIGIRGLISSSLPGSLGETMVDDICLQLKQALADDDVKAIVLAIDSPGGEVTASDLIYQAVVKARERKPVVVYMGSLAASGGYYIACGGSYLLANETTFTGSIGVIMETLNYEKLFDKIGLDMLVFKSGEFKDMLSGARQPTEEEKKYVQSLVMETYGKFVGIVARERKLDEQALRTGLADGRVISGKAALENKLIDGIGNAEDAYAKAMALGKAPGAEVVRYSAGMKLGKLLKLLGKAGGAEQSRVEISLQETLRSKLEPGRLYFLPSTFAH